MKSLFKHAFYSILCPILLFLQVDKLLRLVSPHRRLIIMYHGICRPGTGLINGRHLDVRQFEKQLAYFRKNFDIVPLHELSGDARKRRHTIALTFDDGYVNNIANALPLLKRYGVPATFFVSTAALRDREYIHPTDYLDLINNSINDGEVNLDGKRFKKENYHLKSVENPEQNAYEYINSMGLDTWTKTLSQLRVTYSPEQLTKHVREEFYRVMTAGDVKELLTSDLVTVGSHGHLHVNHVMLTAEEVKNQLETSQNILRELGYNEPLVLAFPYGSYTDRELAIGDELGFEFLIAGGSVESRHAGKVFPRIGILNLASFAFNILSISRGFRRFGF